MKVACICADCSRKMGSLQYVLVKMLTALAFFPLEEMNKLSKSWQNPFPKNEEQLIRRTPEGIKDHHLHWRMVQFITRAAPGIPPRRMHLVQWDQEGYHYPVVCDTDNIQWTSQWWQTTIEIWKTNWKIEIKIGTDPDKDDNLKYLDLRAIAHMSWWSSSTAIEDSVH